MSRRKTTAALNMTTIYSEPMQGNKVAKIRNRYNQVPHLTQELPPEMWAEICEQGATYSDIICSYITIWRMENSHI